MQFLSFFKPNKRQTAGSWLEAFCKENNLDFKTVAQPYSATALSQPVSHKFKETFLNLNTEKVTSLSQATASQAISSHSPTRASTSSYATSLFSEADMLSYIRTHASEYRALAQASYDNETQRLAAERNHSASLDTFLTSETLSSEKLMSQSSGDNLSFESCHPSISSFSP